MISVSRSTDRRGHLWPLHWEYRRTLKAGGTLISSGILKEQQDQALNELHKLGFKERVIKEQGEWIMIEASLA